MSVAVGKHKAHAPERVACAVITISDSRTEGTDESGRLLKSMLTAAGHTVPVYLVVKDDPDAIASAVSDSAETCEAIVTNGGTGLSPHDVTIEALTPHLEKILPGFGELFRMLSYREIGSAAMMSRALAGVYRGRLLFCLPGSPKAVELAAKSLILPELGHAVGVMRH